MNTIHFPDSLYTDIFHNSLENMIVADMQGTIVLVNDQCLGHLQYQHHELVGQKIEHFLNLPDTSTTDFATIWKTVRRDALWQGDVFLKGKEHLHLLRVSIKQIQNSESATPPVYLLSARDIVAPKGPYDNQLLTEVFDQLTALPNRFLFKKKLEYALEQAKRFRFNIGFLYIDLDNFKFINKTYGYLAGDEVLMMAARRLEATARKSDIIGYLGGDEFGIALVNISLPRLAATVANRFLVQISLPFIINNEKLNLGASIGIGVFPADGHDYETLVNCAETAMYTLKNQPEPERSYRFFQQAMNADSSIRLRLESDLRQALDKGEFEIFYQPICNLRSGHITGMEALIRWRHPQRGLVAPNQFIPIAEDLGLIIPIGNWVLYTACMQAKAWQALTRTPLLMSVNLSQVQFRDQQLLDKINTVLAHTEYDPEFLQLEITESSLTEDTQIALEVLKNLKDLNVHIAIDDFGIGNSSLGTLKNLPVDTLKLDKSFIRSLPENQNDQAIVQTILSLGKIMDLKIIAEGIETREQLEFMKKTSCDAYQGFYFSKPLPDTEITELLKKTF